MPFIPLPLLAECLKSPFYAQCCLCGNRHVQLHHNFQYAGQSISEAWCLLPLCPTCHAIEKRRDIKEKLNWIMLNRASLEELKRYSKVENLLAKKERLNLQFGGAFSENK